MKLLASSYMWWPGLDHDVEGIVRMSYAEKFTFSNPTSQLALG